MLLYTALQGVDLGRPLGHWFGPNNVAQVIKYAVYIYNIIQPYMDTITIFRKLAIHDTWNQLVVHVAMDMLVVMDDIGMGNRSHVCHVILVSISY